MRQRIGFKTAYTTAIITIAYLYRMFSIYQKLIRFFSFDLHNILVRFIELYHPHFPDEDPET